MKTTLADTINQAIETAKANLHKALKDGLASLFEAHPNVKSVQFTAYTPYFNDGEECTYRCQADDCTFNGWEEYEDSDIEAEGEDILKNSQRKDWNNKENPNYNKAAKDAVDAFRTEFGRIQDEAWKMIVGDHVYVNITPKGITTTPYDHE